MTQICILGHFSSATRLKRLLTQNGVADFLTTGPLSFRSLLRAEQSSLLHLIGCFGDRNSLVLTNEIGITSCCDAPGLLMSTTLLNFNALLILGSSNSFSTGFVMWKYGFDNIICVRGYLDQQEIDEFFCRFYLKVFESGDLIQAFAQQITSFRMSKLLNQSTNLEGMIEMFSLRSRNKFPTDFQNVVSQRQKRSARLSEFRMTLLNLSAAVNSFEMSSSGIIGRFDSDANLNLFAFFLVKYFCSVTQKFCIFSGDCTKESLTEELRKANYPLQFSNSHFTICIPHVIVYAPVAICRESVQFLHTLPGKSIVLARNETCVDSSHNWRELYL
jgi:hypothetical protein